MVFEIPKEVKKQNIDSMKIKKEILDYLHQSGYTTIQDVIDHQFELPGDYKGYIIAYLAFGLTL